MKRATHRETAFTLSILLLVVTSAAASASSAVQTTETSAGAAKSDPEALLQTVGETYLNLKRYQFDFTLLTEIRSESGRKSVETHIDLTSIRPDRLRMLISGGLGELQVYSDATFAWVYVPPLKQYTRKTARD